MSDALTVRKDETGVVRLFRLDMPPEQARFLQDEPAALADKLGVQTLDTDHADIVHIDDLDELGLAGYLTEGIGVAGAAIASDRAMLAALKGYVLVLLSRAFGGRAAEIRPGDGVTLLRTYGQVPTDWSGGHIETESAKPGSGVRMSPRAARAQARRIGGSIFAVFMILIALIVWVVAT